MNAGVSAHPRPRAGRGHAVDEDSPFLDLLGGIVEVRETALEQREQRHE